MLIFALDDEPAMLAALCEAIEQAEPGAQVEAFQTAQALLDALGGEGPRPDVIFSDIRLPGMDGLHLAERVRGAVPHARIVFVTAYPQYAMEAYRRHVNGYVVKPVDAAQIRAELDALGLLRLEPGGGRLEVRCFGSFEVFWQGEPLMFSRTQAKELLAYLVDREGAACTSGEVAAALWEETVEEKTALHRLRTILSELRATLRGIDMEPVLIRAHRQLAVRRELLDCDYYRLLEGDPDAIRAYRGVYMAQYSWAEMTAARLHFRYGAGEDDAAL